MSSRVLRYTISPSPQPLDYTLPRGARILSVGIKPGDRVISLWALCPADVEDEVPVFESRTLWCVGTGSSELPHASALRHIGTVIDQNAEVYHLFEQVGIGGVADQPPGLLPRGRSFELGYTLEVRELLMTVVASIEVYDEAGQLLSRLDCLAKGLFKEPAAYMTGTAHHVYLRGHRGELVRKMPVCTPGTTGGDAFMLPTRCWCGGTEYSIDVRTPVEREAP